MNHPGLFTLCPWHNKDLQMVRKICALTLVVISSVCTVCPVINGPEPDLPPLHFEELLRFGNSTPLMPRAQQCHIMSRMEAV